MRDRDTYQESTDPNGTFTSTRTHSEVIEEVTSKNATLLDAATMLRELCGHRSARVDAMINRCVAAAESKSSSLANIDARCDMAAGPCACGAWHKPGMHPTPYGDDVLRIDGDLAGEITVGKRRDALNFMVQGEAQFVPVELPELPMGWQIYRRRGAAATVLCRRGYIGEVVVATSEANDVDALRNLAWQHARGEDPEWVRFLGALLPDALGRDRLTDPFRRGEGDVKRAFTTDSFPGVLLGMLIDVYTDGAPRPWQALEVDIGDGKKAWLLCDADGVSLERLPHHALHGPAFVEWVNRIDSNRIVSPLAQVPGLEAAEPAPTLRVEGSTDVWFTTIVDGRPISYSSADLLRETGQATIVVRDGDTSWIVTPLAKKRTSDYMSATVSIQGPASLVVAHHSWIIPGLSTQFSWADVNAYPDESYP
jgi:hypothetical protein